MLAMMMLSQHFVSAFKTVRPHIPRGAYIHQRLQVLFPDLGNFERKSYNQNVKAAPIQNISSEQMESALGAVSGLNCCRAAVNSLGEKFLEIAYLLGLVL